jgi:hypothetical protein|tara:strand:+ start:425 stop:799 length:375 start_codon:yes stop_codon:yes gene_type:complete
MFMILALFTGMNVMRMNISLLDESEKHEQVTVTRDVSREGYDERPNIKEESLIDYKTMFYRKKIHDLLYIIPQSVHAKLRMIESVSDTTDLFDDTSIKPLATANLMKGGLLQDWESDMHPEWDL